MNGIGTSPAPTFPPPFSSHYAATPKKPSPAGRATVLAIPPDHFFILLPRGETTGTALAFISIDRAKDLRSQQPFQQRARTPRTRGDIMKIRRDGLRNVLLGSLLLVGAGAG